MPRMSSAAYTAADAMLLWRDEKWPKLRMGSWRLAWYFCAMADAAMLGGSPWA